MLRYKLRMYTYQIKEVAYVNNRRKVAIKYGIAGSVIFGVFVTSFLPSFLINESINELNQRQSRFPTDLKYILMWTSGKEMKVEFSPGQTSFIKHQCPVFNCFVSYKKSLLGNDMRNFDAVVFNIREILKFRKHSLNFNRSPRQLYILHSLEPASRIPICSPKFNNFFNLTWTYKLDSDIPHPFFNIHNRSRAIIGPRKDIAWLSKLKHDPRNMQTIDHKSKAIAWIVTDCKSMIKHQKFITEFKAELAGYNYTLDIYGKCGYKSCTGKSRFKCYKMIEQDYFFSLVTEESSSEDWVTEKMVNTLNHIAIPVVIGGANYSSFLPPGSYVDAKSLSMKELGAVINYLIQNLDMYSFFFDWKNHYYYTPRSRSYLCDLCAVINKNTRISKSYEDIRKWWNPLYKKRCEKELMKELLYSSVPDYGNN